MNISTGLIWLAVTFALVGFIIITQAQWREPLQRINDEMWGFVWVAAAAAIALMQIFIGVVHRLLFG